MSRSRRRAVKIFLSSLVGISFILVLASCSLLPSSNKPAGDVSSGYPDSVVYKMTISSDTYLCSSFNVTNTDTEISLHLIDVYSVDSSRKIIWLGKEKDISAVKIEKITK